MPKILTAEELAGSCLYLAPLDLQRTAQHWQAESQRLQAAIQDEIDDWPATSAMGAYFRARIVKAMEK